MTAVEVPATAQAAPVVEARDPRAQDSLRQVVGYVELLHTALVDDASFYAGLVRRGFLESAIQHARFAIETLRAEHSASSYDALVAETVEEVVLEALVAARSMGAPDHADARLVERLDAAEAAARTASRALVA